MLHLPRQRRRARRANRRRGVEDLHDRRRTRTAALVCRRHGAARALRRRCLVRADDRRQARRAVRRVRQRLQWSPADDDGRDPRVRSENRKTAMGAADGAGTDRRVRLHSRRGELWHSSGARFRLRRVAPARHAARRPSADRRGPEVGRRVRARSRQEGPTSLALSRRWRQRARRHSVGRRFGR